MCILKVKQKNTLLDRLLKSEVGYSVKSELSVRTCGDGRQEGRACPSKRKLKRVLGVGHPIRKDKGILNMGRLRLIFVSACFQFILHSLETNHCVHRFHKHELDDVHMWVSSC